MHEVAPVKVGMLVDYVDSGESVDPLVERVFRLVFDEYLEAGVLERPIELVLRAAQGLPNGSSRAVRDAFFELVAEDCVVIFGPYVSENGEPLRRYVEELAEVAVVSMAGTENMLGEWVFALNNGSMEEEPIIMAAVCRHDGRESVGIAYESSLIGQEYLATARRACVDAGLRITGEVAIPQVATEKRAAMEELRAGKPDAIVHVGFGLGLLGMNEALDAIRWMPPRYTTTAFEFAHGSEMWMQQLAGWVGLDSFDERNPVAQDFLDRYDARHGERPEYFMPVYCYDMARMIALAIAGARPLTGPGVKEALEHVKMVPAASGAPGTRMRFGRYIRQGWVGAEYLVARRVLPDASRTVFHGTIEGTLGPAEDLA
jgi:ABC-type branched-subunit amino acid transport system substrate-binding protein